MCRSPQPAPTGQQQAASTQHRAHEQGSQCHTRKVAPGHMRGTAQPLGAGTRGEGECSELMLLGRGSCSQQLRRFIFLKLGSRK